MKIAAVQMVSSPDVAENLARARHWMAEAAAQGAKLVALPEYFCLMGLADNDKLKIAEDFGAAAAPIQRLLAETARELGVWLIGGTLPIRAATPDHVRNACCVYNPQGELAARYDKLHLFRFDNGREHYDEGRVLEQGDVPVTVDVTAEGRSWRVGLSVCYDLRFPELYRAMSFTPGQPPCDLIAVPAAFTHTTGEAHWELLLRARAVENQAYVIAPAQGGLHANGRRTWGHSLVIDPWGQVLACHAEGEGLAIAEIDAERLAAVRSQLPALQHRRL
ncbi:carbon-nitrogen hydrolase family protein [Paucibacter sp. APW11]|uniref:Carbon-nitrogen hydrolase family protein n=1 Tax=Roseateles aquae TaxID=3077235 RepID=A0ABU3PAA4_9BURK|nr:carbon-nitrogen hydrolase family protein [Paucibacter sp. APW11]MDT8999514.1 carbon-nitrogen hydrolase family protein [Paucibacter sp. APW11]